MRHWLILVVAAILLAFGVEIARAAPLTVHAHPANLDDQLAIGRVCIDLHPKKRTTARLSVTGAAKTFSGLGTVTFEPGYKPTTKTFHLRTGHRRFCRAVFPTLTVLDTTPDRPGLARSEWNTYESRPLNLVVARLTVGSRTFERSVQFAPTFTADG